MQAGWVRNPGKVRSNLERSANAKHRVAGIPSDLHHTKTSSICTSVSCVLCVGPLTFTRLVLDEIAICQPVAVEAEELVAIVLNCSHIRFAVPSSSAHSSIRAMSSGDPLSLKAGLTAWRSSGRPEASVLSFSLRRYLRSLERLDLFFRAFFFLLPALALTQIARITDVGLHADCCLGKHDTGICQIGPCPRTQPKDFDTVCGIRRASLRRCLRER